MHGIKTLTAAIAAVSTVAVTVPVYDASASGIAVARFGGEHGHPTTDNPTAMYYNPAGLALRPGRLRLYLDGTFAWRSFTYNRPAEAVDYVFDGSEPAGQAIGGTPQEGIAANSGEASLFNIVGAPFIGVASDLGVENLGVGLSFYAPFGGQSKYDKQDKVDGFPGAEDGPQRWWAIEGVIRSLYITGAVAYRLPELKLTLGAGINLVKSEVYTARARLGSGHDHLVSRTRAPNGAVTEELLEGRAVLDVASWDLAASFGLIWEPTDGMYVGLSYQSQPGFGENKLTGTNRRSLAEAEANEGDAQLKQQMPDVIRAGWRMRSGNQEYRLFGDYIRWSLLENQCARAGDEAPGTCGLANIPRFWDNAFGVRGGYSYFLGARQDTELYGGLGYDGNAVPDATLEPALSDFEKFTAAVGARFMLMEDEEGRPGMIVSGTYTQVFYMSRDTSARASSANRESDTTGTPFATARNPDSAGEYKQAIGVLNLNLEYIF